jgi:hypothetical protein
MRAWPPLILALLLEACGGAAEEKSATLDDDGKIDCRVGADTQFTRFCSIERSKAEQGTLITVRKPDGGFRRLLTTRDGRGVVAADGAEQAEVTIIGDNLIEVAIAGDSFRLPARIGRAPAAKQ